MHTNSRSNIWQEVFPLNNIPSIEQYANMNENENEILQNSNKNSLSVWRDAMHYSQSFKQILAQVLLKLNDKTNCCEWCFINAVFNFYMYTHLMYECLLGKKVLTILFLMFHSIFSHDFHIIRKLNDLHLV